MNKVLGKIPQELLHKIMGSTGVGIAISDPSKADNPLIYVNSKFLNQTGYDLEDCIGKNCRFLQGPDTDEKTVSKIRLGLESAVHTEVRILNYKKDGTPFWNELHISPIFDGNNNLIYFCGINKDITEQVLNEKVLKETIRKQEQEIKRLKRELEKIL